jgi:ABC-type transport system substrate-binding protein
MRVLATLLALIALLLASPGPAPAGKDTLTIGMPSDVPIFDTHKATGLYNGSILNQVSEPLVLLSSKGEAQPWLAESWEQSRDGKSWTIKLRKGVKFTDGSPLTAEAVKFSLERFRKHSIGKATLAIVETITAVDEHTLRLTTKAPYAPMINTLGYHWIVVHDDDVGDLVTTVHMVNASLAERGYENQLLASVFPFRAGGDVAYLVYLFKRGTFYPFVPAPGGGERRDNQKELQIQGALTGEVPLEADLTRWFPIWGAPVP